jgi:hypothetical protein
MPSMPYHFTKDGVVHVGGQLITVIDLESEFILLPKPLEQPFGAVPPDAVATLLADAFRKYQRPKVGVVIGISVWGSLAELLIDPDTRPRFQQFHRLGIDWPQWTDQQRSVLEQFCSERNLLCEWSDREGLLAPPSPN